ncbi:MAG: peptidase C1, partial [Ignavibacteria bacterium]|nr:peptidase C1 [Ignavibacteria bacterium]
MKILAVILMIIILVFNGLVAQDKAEYQKKYIWNSEQTILTADFSKVVKPNMQDFKNQVFHFDPVRQDTTGTCWSFCTTSFLESEIFRTQHKRIKLSEMHTVYWEYIEKARRFLREKGNSVFKEGSQSNFAIERIMQYGCVPLDIYTGLINGQI